MRRASCGCLLVKVFLRMVCFFVCVCVCVCATQVLMSQSSTVFFFIALEICSDERSPRFRLSCDFVASHAAKVCQFAAEKRP